MFEKDKKLPYSLCLIVYKLKDLFDNIKIVLNILYCLILSIFT
jgi:hypothetical protein